MMKKVDLLLNKYFFYKYTYFFIIQFSFYTETTDISVSL